MGKNKNILLLSGTEEGFRWMLTIDGSANKRVWEGHFVFSGSPLRLRRKTCLMSGSPGNYWKWDLCLNISAYQQHNWQGFFTLADKSSRYCIQRRQEDRDWAERTFPRHWKQQFEIHHEWDRGEYCYFLTREEHRAIHQL